MGDGDKALYEAWRAATPGREDGMAAGSTAIVEAQIQAAGSSEMADIVILSQLTGASYQDTQVGITNAHKLLKPEGALLLVAPEDKFAALPNVVTAGEMLDMAGPAGFSTKVMKGNRSVSPATLLLPEMSVIFMILRK